MRCARVSVVSLLVATWVSCAFAATSVRLPDEVVGPTATDVAVKIVADTGGTDLASLDLRFTYDDAKLQLTGVYRTGLTAPFVLLYNNHPNPAGADSLDIGLYTAHPVAVPPGDHDVVWVVFRVLSHPDQSLLVWEAGETFVNDDIPETLHDGSIDSSTAAVGFSMPDDANGAPSGPAALVWVPVTVNPAPGLHAFDVEVLFNPAVILATSVDKTDATAGFTLTTNLTTPGKVNISLFSIDPIIVPGAQDVAKIRFQVVGGIGDRTPLDLTVGTADDGFMTYLDDGLLTICPDGDLDGVTACGGDCDDTDPARYPGNAEICDGKDNDCDGQADEGVLTTFYRDADGDGYGDAVRGQEACTAPSGYVASDADCDDSNASIHPGAGDSSCDGVDDNCNGSADEGYVSTPTSCGVGACASTGVTSCVAGVVQDSCVAGTPAASDTTCNGIDDNCNGIVDEGIAAVGDTLRVNKSPVTGAALVWNAGVPGTIHNVYRGYHTAGNAWQYDQQCLATGVTTASASDAVQPPPFTLFYYLVASACASGSESELGVDSAGVPIPNPISCPATNPDTDGDGMADIYDNCPGLSNPSQADQDGDFHGDVCDNCLATFNPDQFDWNGNGIGDACDPEPWPPQGSP